MVAHLSLAVSTGRGDRARRPAATGAPARPTRGASRVPPDHAALPGARGRGRRRARIPRASRPSRSALTTLIVVLTAVAAHAGELQVMTKNLYLGADLTPVLVAETPEEFLAATRSALAEIAATNFPERARALAEEIGARRPHLVALQEVTNYTLDGVNGAVPFRDHLADLLGALAARGADYVVAAVVQNLAFAIPLPGLGVVGIVDRDVILARADVPAVIVPFGLACARPSGDGCNYDVVAEVPTPLGILAIERGFAGVEATVDGTPVRFVNTHLEIRDAAVPLSGFFQFAQAFQLLATLAVLPALPGMPTIVAGDHNSSPDDPITVVDGLVIVPPYRQFLAAGYADLWTLRPGKPPGFTCCELPDLSNPTSIASERIDLVFASAAPLWVKANVTGTRPSDKTRPSRLWGSDHAGVAALMEFPP
jgi:endonuclease/exonuclease/phosphatase family metal-dependent hydrolase